MHTKRFIDWPSEGNYKPWTVVVTILLIMTVFIGLGQIPLLVALLKSAASQASVAELNEKGMADLLGENYLLTLLLFPFVLCLGAMVFAFKYIHKSKIIAFFTVRPDLDWKRIALSFGLWGGIMAMLMAFSLIYEDKLHWNFKPETFWPLLAICLFIIPLQTTCEELIFRSYLFKSFNFLRIPIFRVILCGFLFGMMHAANPEIDVLGNWALVFYIWTGVFLGIMACLDNGLELSMGYHAVNNIFSALIITNDWQAFQTDALWIDKSAPTLGWEAWLTMFLIQPLILLIFAKKYKWRFKSLIENLDELKLDK